MTSLTIALVGVLYAVLSLAAVVDGNWAWSTGRPSRFQSRIALGFFAVATLCGILALMAS